MKEQIMPIPKTIKKPKPKEELGKERSELMDMKKQYLESLRVSVKEMFGTEELPKDLVLKMLEIRKDISSEVTKAEYFDEIDESTEQKIKRLMFEMTTYGKDTKKVETIGDDSKGNMQIVFEDGSTQIVEQAEKALFQELHTYFDSYRMAHNAARFRSNLKEAQEFIIEENKTRKLNFYSKGEKGDVLIDRVYGKYAQAGFEREEIDELIKTCNLEKLDSLEIHDIKIISKIRDIFSRFMSGDKTKYIGLSAALMVPAFIEGYAPMFLANAFKGNEIEMTQVGLYAILSAASLGGSALIEKQFKNFLDKNFQKEGGYAEHISESVSEFPGDEVGKFGMETIKRRISNAKYSYEEILRTISFDVLPAGVTLATSAAMLYEKSPVLAGGTIAGTGIMMAIDSYVNRKGKFWEKQRRAETETEIMGQKMEELLNAHMEIILSGEKENFSTEIEELLSKERVAMSDRTFLRVIRDKVSKFSGVLNFILAGVATYFAGGTSDKFVASLVYSGNFNEGISRILSAKHKLLSSFRDIVQMESMFNGYAEEEREKEKDRIGMSELKSNDIRLKNMSVEFDKKKILDNINLEIPGGSLVSLEGLSGAGKTTLMKVLAGYYKPTEGTVEIGETNLEDVKKSGPDSIYSKIAYLSQFPYILEDTIKNNLTFGIAGEVSDTEIFDVLKEVGLNERFSSLNENLKGGRGDAGTTSGGETSRIGLARAILKMRKNNSRIVFLDEPTASVDEETAVKIAEIINREKQNNPDVTFISISHDKNFNEKLENRTSVRLEKGKIQ